MYSAQSHPTHRGVVESFLDNQLKPSAHPAYAALRDTREDRKSLAVASSAPIPEQVPLRGVQAPRVQTVDVLDGGKREATVDSSLIAIYRNADKEAELFKQALRTFEESIESSKSKYRTEISSSASNWADVLAEVDKAANRYNNPSGPWGRIRKGYRKLGENAPALKAWLEVAPKESAYLSILLGGLKLIIGSAGRLAHLREDITDALEELPSLLECTNKAVGIWNRSKELHQSGADLYVSVLSTLHHIIWWMSQKSGIRGLKALLKQDAFGLQLIQKMNDLKRSAETFKAVAELCSYDTIRNTNLAVTAHREETRQNQTEMVHMLAENVTEIMSLKMAMADEAQALQARIDTLNEAMARFLSGNDRIDFRTRDERGPILPVRKVDPNERVKAYEALYDCLGIEGISVFSDVESICKIIGSLPRSSQDRAVAIMQESKLHAWIKSLDSSTIFINGNHPITTSNLVPSSFVSAKLTSSLLSLALAKSRTPETCVIPLAFFFGKHSRASDVEYGLEEAVRNLIAQLLDAFPNFSLSVLRKAKRLYNSGRDKDELELLLQILTTLLHQLPADTVVFCILDNLTHYETISKLREDADFLVRSLAGVVPALYSREHDHCVFKLLFMSSWNSRWMHRAVKSENAKAEVVWLPVKVPSVGGFTAMKWGDTVEKELYSSD